MHPASQYQINRRFTSLPRRAIQCAQIFLFLLIAWQCADLAWLLAKPSTGQITAVPDQFGNSATIISQSRLFGQSYDGSTSAVENTVTPTTAITLRGVLSGKKKSKPVAIVSINGQANTLIIEGDELLPGTRLDRVYSDRIELISAKGKEVVTLSR